MASNPAFVGTPKLGLTKIENADGTTAQTLVTAGSSGSKVTGVNVASSDATARTVQFIINRSGTAYVLGTVSIPASSGTDGSAASVAVLSNSLIAGLAEDSDQQPYVFMESGDTLTAALTTGAVTSSESIDIIAVYGDF